MMKMKREWIILFASFFFFSGWMVKAKEGTCYQSKTLSEVCQVNQDGFGDRANKYAFSMAVYKDALYVGTLNIKKMPGMFRFFSATSAKRASNGAQIWRYTPEQGWKQVVKDGLGNPHNLGVRSLKVIGECLYGVTANHDDGMEVWRSCDGENWEKVAVEGFGNPNNTSGRGLGYFKGWIYVGVENRKSGAEIWRSKDGNKWERVAEKGLGDKGNWWVSDFAEFKGYLYLGTLNIKGAQLFRTKDGVNYEPLAKKGLEKFTNTAIMKLYVYQDQLYFSTMDFFLGSDLYRSQDGVNFERVLKKGFVNHHNAYIWQLQEYKGRLYAGTYYHKGFIMLPSGKFMLFSSKDGENWILETDDGFGNKWYYGIRTMTTYQDWLVFGTASAKYGCKVFFAR